MNQQSLLIVIIYIVEFFSIKEIIISFPTMLLESGRLILKMNHKVLLSSSIISKYYY